jgi:5-methylcytosine-specific restriction endonuclease McrA
MVDHIIPIREDDSLRLVLENTQSLCDSCHNSLKQKMESGTYNPVGEDGLPTSPEHPWNK